MSTLFTMQKQTICLQFLKLERISIFLFFVSAEGFPTTVAINKF